MGLGLGALSVYLWRHVPQDADLVRVRVRARARARVRVRSRVRVRRTGRGVECPSHLCRDVRALGPRELAHWLGLGLGLRLTIV